jgi:hypothetical protein
MVRFRPGRIHLSVKWRSLIGRMLDFKSEDMGSSPVAIDSLVSLMVERPAFNRCDAGSIPARGIYIYISACSSKG